MTMLNMLYNTHKIDYVAVELQCLASNTGHARVYGKQLRSAAEADERASGSGHHFRPCNMP